MQHSLKLFFSTILILGLAACGGDDDAGKPTRPTPTPTPTPTPEPIVSIVDVARSHGSFATLIEQLEGTGLDQTLGDLDSTFTVFAPTDDAFAALPDGTLDGLSNEEIANILLYHVIVGSEVDSAAAKTKAASDDPLATMGNEAADSVALSLTGDDLQVNTATVIEPDLQASNGVIHAIDQVLLPPKAVGEPTMTIAGIVVDQAETFSTLYEALQAAGLDDDLDDEAETFTVFAPTNEAFAKIPSDVLAAILADNDILLPILNQHAIADARINSIGAFAANGTQVETAGGALIDVAIVDGALQVGGATVTSYDIYATNGVIHVIDTVIVGDVELPTITITLPVVAGWSNDGKANAIAYDSGVTITPDWSTDDDINIAMYVMESPMDFTGKTVTYVIDVPASYIGSGFNYQPFVQQDSGSYGGSYAGYQPFSALTAGENTVTFVIPGDVPADIQRVGLQIIGADGGTTDVITIKSVTIE